MENIEEVRQVLCNDYAVPRNLLFPEETPEETINRLLDDAKAEIERLQQKETDVLCNKYFLGYLAGLSAAQGIVTCAFHDKEM